VPVEIAGFPHVDLTARVLGPGVHLFFKLVDRETGKVIDFQAESLRLDNPSLSLASEHVGLDLVGVFYRLPAGHHLELQISTSSLSHVSYRGASVVQLAGRVSVPIVSG
jgi:hypothetical protein